MQKFLSISFAKSCYSVRKIEITLGIFRLWKLEHVTFLIKGQKEALIRAKKDLLINGCPLIKGQLMALN